MLTCCFYELLISLIGEQRIRQFAEEFLQQVSAVVDILIEGFRIPEINAIGICYTMNQQLLKLSLLGL